MAGRRTPLLRGLLSGAPAGLVTGLAGLVYGVPTIEAAIALEGAGEEPLLSRTTQQAGLVLGLVLVGAALGLLFALAYRLVPDDVQARPWTRSLALALGAFTALSLVPFLRYPANPPGVGDPATVGIRTSAYLLAVALGVAVTTGAFAACRALARHDVPAWQRQAGVCLAAVVLVGVAFALLPASADSSLGDTPAGLIWDFRLRALGLQVLLYALLGGIFGALSERAVAAVRPDAVPVRA